MYKYLLLIMIIIIQGCTSIEVGGQNPSVTKVSKSDYVLRMDVSGPRAEAAISKEVDIHGKSLCLGTNFEITRLKSETNTSMVMVNGSFVNTYFDKVSILIKCLEIGNVDLIYIAKGEEIDKPDGYSKVRIFNSSNDILYSDNTGYVYVEVGQHNIAKLPKKQYIDVYIKNGKTLVNLSHIDVLKFSGKNEVNLNGKDINLEVWASPVSTKSKVVSDLPSNFNDKYVPYLEKENITGQSMPFTVGQPYARLSHSVAHY